MKKSKPLIPSFFSTLKLKTRLLITYLCLSILILLLTTLTFFSSSKQVMIKNAARASEQQLSIITNNLSEKIGHITDYATTLTINSEIADVLKVNPIVPDNSLDKFLVNSTLTKQAQRIIGLHQNIFQWDILDTENNWFHASTTITDELDSYLTPALLESLDLKDSNKIHFLGPARVTEEPVFIAIKPITDIDTTRYLGTAVLLIRESNISSSFRDLPESDSRQFYIIDDSDQILTATNSHGVFEDFTAVTGIAADDFRQLKASGSVQTDIAGEDMLIIKKDYPGMDWHVINIIPVNSLHLETNTLLQQILIICLILFSLSLLFSIICTRSVTSPIKTLAEKMQDAGQGSLNITASYHSRDEISILYNQFNIMVAKVNQLLQDIYEEQQAKQEMEIKLLQAQINPHFLYNTLNMIKSLIELEMTPTAIKAISTMSAFYRNSLSKGNFIITLDKEIELTEQYLYLENLRYPEYSDYEIKIATDYPLNEMKIPKLTLQPLLENIFVHAISGEFCHISIEITEQQDDLIIAVKDNGLGIAPERLNQLNALLEDRMQSENSFGIPSIHWRIRLLYGPPYGLNIESREHQYTTITITLPKGGNGYEDTGHYR